MYLERHGRELMIGVVRDPVFGPAISFGLGGTMVEVIRDRAVALPPLNPFLARDLIRRTRASLALQPLRGAPAAAQEVVEDILLRVSEIVQVDANCLARRGRNPRREHVSKLWMRDYALHPTSRRFEGHPPGFPAERVRYPSGR